MGIKQDLLAMAQKHNLTITQEMRERIALKINELSDNLTRNDKRKIFYIIMNELAVYPAFRNELSQYLLDKGITTYPFTIEW